MYNEKETSAVVQKILTQLDIPFTTGWGKNQHMDVYPGPGGYGVVADIGTGKQPCVLLRADMDALPILERTEGIDEFKSKNDNRMHACVSSMVVIHKHGTSAIIISKRYFQENLANIVIYATFAGSRRPYNHVTRCSGCTQEHGKQHTWDW